MEVNEIIRDIDDIFAKDSLLNEFGVIFSTDPPYVVHVEHKLGMSMSCLKEVYKFAVVEFHKCLMQLKQTNAFFENVSFTVKMNSVSRIILLIKGDNPMAFIARKHLIENHCYSENSEISLLNVVFTKHPKSPSGWQHRRWCISRMFPNEIPQIMLQTELACCEKFCDLYPKNYYAWIHRLWLLKFMTIDNLLDEVVFCRQWLSKHCSDHSAVNHFRQCIGEFIRRICCEDKLLINIEGVFEFDDSSLESSDSEIELSDLGFECVLFSELLIPIDDSRRPWSAVLLYLLRNLWFLSQKWITSYPGHESLWSFRRSLVSLSFSYLCFLKSDIQDISNDMSSGQMKNRLLMTKHNWTTFITHSRLENCKINAFLRFMDAKMALLFEYVLTVIDELIVCYHEALFVLFVLLELQNASKIWQLEDQWHYEQQVHLSIRYLISMLLSLCSVDVISPMEVSCFLKSVESPCQSTIKKDQEIWHLIQFADGKHVEAFRENITVALKGPWQWSAFLFFIKDLILFLNQQLHQW